MSSTPIDDVLEARVRQCAAAGEVDRATKLALEGYGPEVLGYLRAVATSVHAAEDVFSQWCERVWRGIGSFRGDASVRTWLYAIARNLLVDQHRSQGRRRDLLPLSEASEVSRLAAALRSSTATGVRESRSRLQEIRQSLEPDERSLLVLRIDRELSWNEIALIVAHDGASADELRATAARLRKQFERLKARLSTLADAPSPE